MISKPNHSTTENLKIKKYDLWCLTTNLMIDFRIWKYQLRRTKIEIIWHVKVNDLNG